MQNRLTQLKLAEFTRPIAPSGNQIAIVESFMIFNPDFREFIELLNKHNVRYLLIGGYAVAIHGHPRYTKDLDIWIQMDQSN